MLNFCTLFDSNYLNRGIVMYDSLHKQCNDFHLYIFSFNDLAHEILNQMKLSHVTVISRKEFEDAELLKVKPTRSPAEYCWTCTPSVILYCIEKYSLDHCTYIDADLCFYSNPDVLIDEMKEKSVLITEHRYTPMYDRSKLSGKYCVQFITFKNNDEGLTVLKWWRNACLEWCYSRLEEGKFGDQMYLDDWTTRFKGVHVLQHPGGGLAPWNVQQYDLKKTGESLTGIQKKDAIKFDVVFYHFHYVRFLESGNVDLGWFTLSHGVMELFYKPYIRLLSGMNTELKKTDARYTVKLSRISVGSSHGVKDKIKTLLKIVIKYNVYNVQKLTRQHGTYN